MTVQSELDRETSRIDTLAATLRVVCDLKRADDCGDVMIMLRVEAGTSDQGGADRNGAPPEHADDFQQGPHVGDGGGLGLANERISQ